MPRLGANSGHNATAFFKWLNLPPSHNGWGWDPSGGEG
jgi:hypothetical protein